MEEQAQQLITLSPRLKTGATSLLVAKRNELTTLIADVEKLKKEIDVELSQRVTTSGVDNKLVVDGSLVYLITKPLFTGVTLTTARRFKAVKEVVDTSILLPMLKAGKTIKGVSYSSYIMVKKPV